jgi:hypothetical protein
MALANKALQVSLQQISGITNLSLPTLATTVEAMQSIANSLPLINQQKTPIGSDTRAYYLNVLGAYGTGVCNTLLTVDFLGTAAGYNIATPFDNTARILKTMNTTYLQSCYQTMLNCLNGNYTVEIPPEPPPDPPIAPSTWEVIIPGGLPGAGTYGPYATAALAVNAAFTTGLIPATRAALAAVVAAYPTQCATMTNNFNAVCQQMGNEQDLQVRAGLDWSNYYANLQANTQTSTMGFIFGLPVYGQDTIEGGAAQFIQYIADYTPITGTITINQPVVTNIPEFLGVNAGKIISGANIPTGTTVSSFNIGAGTLTMNQNANATVQLANLVVGNAGGQAVVGVMIQGRNQVALNNAGILTNNNVPLNYPVPPAQANLII